MRHAMLTGAAALLAATVGVNLYAEDYQHDSSDTATQTETSADVSADAQAAPSTQPLDRSHLNDEAAESDIGTEKAMDDASTAGGTIDSSSADTGDNLSRPSDDATMDSGGQTHDASVSGSADYDANDTIGSDTNSDLDARPASDREMGATTQPSDSQRDDGANLNDNPTDSAPNEVGSDTDAGTSDQTAQP